MIVGRCSAVPLQSAHLANHMANYRQLTWAWVSGARAVLALAAAAAGMNPLLEPDVLAHHPEVVQMMHRRTSRGGLAHGVYYTINGAPEQCDDTEFPSVCGRLGIPYDDFCALLGAKGCSGTSKAFMKYVSAGTMWKRAHSTIPGTRFTRYLIAIGHEPGTKHQPGSGGRCKRRRRGARNHDGTNQHSGGSSTGRPGPQRASKTARAAAKARGKTSAAAANATAVFAAVSAAAGPSRWHKIMSGVADKLVAADIEVPDNVSDAEVEQWLYEATVIMSGAPAARPCGSVQHQHQPPPTPATAPAPQSGPATPPTLLREGR